MSESNVVLHSRDTATVSQDWSEIVEQVTRQRARVLVEADGVPVAAIVSVADLRRLSQLDEQRAQFLATLERTQDAFADVPDAELTEEIAQALAAVRGTPNDSPPR
jgi:prevent-host-death family protein